MMVSVPIIYSTNKNPNRDRTAFRLHSARHDLCKKTFNSVVGITCNAQPRAPIRSLTGVHRITSSFYGIFFLPYTRFSFCKFIYYFSAKNNETDTSLQLILLLSIEKKRIQFYGIVRKLRQNEKATFNM